MQTPPSWIDRILRKICDPYLLEGILGDLHEIYRQRIEAKGVKKARFWYAFDAIGFLRPFTWKKISFYPFIPLAMIHNYLKIAFRNLLKYKMNTGINLFGLTLGMIGCLLIGLFVWDEMQYDTFHPEADRIYRLYTHRDAQGEGESSALAIVSPAMGPTMTVDFPEVEESLRLLNVYGKVLFKVEDLQFLEENGMYAEPAIFNFFHLPLISGSAENALTEPRSVVITEEVAQKYFGEEDALGKTITIDGGDAKVTGVLEPLSEHFHLDFDYLLSFSTLKGRVSDERMNSWVWQQFFTYLKLTPQANAKTLEAKFPAFVEQHAWPQTQERGFTYVPFIQSVKDIHLYASDFRWDIAKRGNVTYVYGLSIIGLFLLLIACINFINLSTARAERRAKEVGIRKVVGAYRGQIIFQFIGEAVLLALFASGMALVFTWMVLPHLNEFSGKSISFSLLEQPLIFGGLLGIGLLIGVLAGSYPAFVISAFRPVHVLSGSKGGSGKRGNLLRKSLVVLQFSISILLIISTFIIQQQVSYFSNKDHGFDREQLVTFPMRGKMKQDYETTKAEFERIPGVLTVSAGFGLPGDIVSGDDFKIPGEEQTRPANVFCIDHDYISTMGMEIIAGRDFSKELSTDLDEAFILNETAVRGLGLGSPQEIIGQEIHWNMWDHNQELKKGRVIGVVKDFHFKSLHEEIGPSMLHIYPSAFWKIALRVKEENIAETMTAIHKAWDSFGTGYPLDYNFVDDSFEAMYRNEQKLSSLLLIFTVLTIFVACIGLLGLISFAAEQRTKEIGIRKVLGASSSNIVRLLSIDFLKLVFIAIVIATPIAWYFMKEWLANFSYRIEMSAWTFVLAGFCAILIALLTISFQTVRAALRNPVESLRYE